MTSTIQNFALEDFLHGDIEGHELQRSDVVLVQSKGSIFSKAIRWATQSRFNHAALVFAVPHTKQGFNRAFLIESSRAGVDLTALDQHTDRPSHEDALVIMRLEQDWFTVDQQKQVRGELLNSIKANYDYLSIFRIALVVATSIFWGQRSKAPQRIKSIIRKRFKIKGLVPLRFICSGFVQFGYWHTLRKNLSHIDSKEVYFGGATPEDNITDADLLTQTPEDLFQTDKLSIKYFIAGQRVYVVDNREDCLKLLKQATDRTLEAE